MVENAIFNSRIQADGGEPQFAEHHNHPKLSPLQIERFRCGIIKARGSCLSNVIVCFSAQFLLCSLLFGEIVRDNDIISQVTSKPSNNWLVASRFICCLILHQQLNGEILEGQGKMKFALNHRHRFDAYKIAFFAGFMQTFSCLFIELVNLFVIITSQTVLEVVLNFMAVAIIAEFDNSFF